MSGMSSKESGYKASEEIRQTSNKSIGVYPAHDQGRNDSKNLGSDGQVSHVRVNAY